ncbi:MAG: transposase [Erythrobacter sp.]|nr:transposase [Erythrobacter sp.]NCQ62425.1 transposase [Alphaproteobacteria bacterium]
MNQQSIIRDIEQCARERRISISALCRRAGIHPDTFRNWRKTPQNPDPVGANLHSVERLYAELRKIDAEDAERVAKNGGVAA